MYVCVEPHLPRAYSLRVYNSSRAIIAFRELGIHELMERMYEFWCSWYVYFVLLKWWCDLIWRKCMRCIHLLIVLIKSFSVFQLPLKTFATKHNLVNWTLRNRGCSGRVNCVHGSKFFCDWRTQNLERARKTSERSLAKALSPRGTLDYTCLLGAWVRTTSPRLCCVMYVCGLL